MTPPLRHDSPPRITLALDHVCPACDRECDCNAVTYCGQCDYPEDGEDDSGFIEDPEEDA